MRLNSSILPAHASSFTSHTHTLFTLINLKCLPIFSIILWQSWIFLIPLFCECNPMPGLCLWAHAGHNWTRLEPVAVMGSLTLWGYHTHSGYVGVYGCIYTSLCVCSDVWGYKSSNRASRAWHKQAALVISKAVNIDYLKWLSHYTHKYTLITHPWVDIFRFCLEKCKAISSASYKQPFINFY